MTQITEFLKRHSLASGIILMFLLTWPIDLGHAAETRGLLPFQIPFAIYIFLGWGFVFASIIMTWSTLGRGVVIALLKRFLIWRVDRKWYLVALLLFPLTYFAAVLVNATFAQVTPDFNTVFAYKIFGPSANLTLLFLPYLLFDAITNGEEIGWRGYVLPRLQAKYSALVSSLIVGVIWGLWHIPKFLTAGNNSSFALMMAEILAKAVVYTWLYNNTKGSLLLVTLLHAAGNAAGVFLPIANTATGSNSNVLIIAIVLEVLTAIVVTVIDGSTRLSRIEPKQVQA